MNKKIIFFLCCFPVILFAKDITANAFIEIKISTEELQKICVKNQKICDADSGRLWKIKGTKESIYYVIDSSPTLLKIEKIKNKYNILNVWNFSKYQHSYQSLDEEGITFNGMKIYPALYPLNNKDYAIALINEWFAGYSGGGKVEQFADFLLLHDDNSYDLAIRSIPFYSSEMIRACFSQEEYWKSPHCHDETGSILNIQFKDIGKKYYQWTLTYADFDWPSFVSEQEKRTSKFSEIITPFHP